MLLSRNSARLSRKRAPLLAPAVVRFRGACVERPPSRACAARVLFLEADDERRCCSPRSFARVLFLVAVRRVACVRAALRFCCWKKLRFQAAWSGVRALFWFPHLGRLLLIRQFVDVF